MKSTKPSRQRLAKATRASQRQHDETWLGMPCVLNGKIWGKNVQRPGMFQKVTEASLMLDPRAELIQIDLSVHAHPSCKSMYVQNYKKRSFKKLWLQVFQFCPSEENWPWPDCAAAQPFPSPKNLAFSNRLEFSSAYCFWRVVRFSRISFQVLFLVSSDLTMPAEVAGTSNLDPSTTSYLHFGTLQGVWKLGGPTKNQRTMFFFANCHMVPPMLP